MHSRTQRQTHWQRWELHWAMLLSTDADRSLVDHKLCRCRGDPSEARLKKKPPANNPEQGKQDVIGCSSGETDATVILEDTKQAGKPAASGGKSRSWILYSLLPDGSRIAVIPKSDKDITKTENCKPTATSSSGSVLEKHSIFQKERSLFPLWPIHPLP